MGGRLLVDCFKELTRTLRSAVNQVESEATYGNLTSLQFYMFIEVQFVCSGFIRIYRLLNVN